MIRLKTLVLVAATVTVAPTFPSVIGLATPGPMLQAQTRRSVPPKLPPAESHAQAYALMIQGDFAKARPLLEQAFKDTPIEKHNRAMVLNRAILDLTQKTLMMRAVKDLSAYLIKNRGEDEYATNVLGGALNISARDPALKQGPLWQSAFKEWDRRNYVLDQSRPGWRRWGTRWVSDDEYAKIKAEREALRQSVMDAQDRVNQASIRANSLITQYQTASTQLNAYGSLMGYLQSYTNVPQTTWNQLSTTGQGILTQGAVQAYVDANSAVQQLGPEVQAAVQEYQDQATLLQTLETKVIRPEWPTEFEPVDPSGPEANHPAHLTTQPATAPAVFKFGSSDIAPRRQPQPQRGIGPGLAPPPPPATQPAGN